MKSFEPIGCGLCSAPECVPPAFREENGEKTAAFHPDRIFGTEEKISLDGKAKQLLVTGADDFRDADSVILEASQIISFEKQIEEIEEEVFFTDGDGSPKKMLRRAYAFRLALKIDSPRLDGICVDLNKGNRPESTDDDRYWEQSMELGELTTLLRSWISPGYPGDHLLGPDVYVISQRKRAVPMNIPAGQTVPGGWTCVCGNENSRNFCTECGRPRP